ncbi:WhiB family transcriptional regulator [Streptomyces sp. NPDC052225]|uniref:WhiB family transcriptional regulator n=1 Tax=Streptomyces sp. NPDC052225 TaxID=3154949 RepID=UPI0034466D4C
MFSPATSSEPPLTRGFPRYDDELDWRRSAACASLPPHHVFTRDPDDAARTLRACNQCPIRAECEAVVDPAHTWFDGVSGGRLWRNGREVPVPGHREERA